MYFESYRPARLLLLLLLMLGGVASAVGQTKPNHLAGEHPPYLKRAMNQPVNWYPWGKDAFGRAEDLNVPILLDVGAVWCPWCGLMDRDTYTNVDTADYTISSRRDVHLNCVIGLHLPRSNMEVRRFATAALSFSRRGSPAGARTVDR